MSTTYKLRTLTLITLCITVFWGTFGLDMTLNPGELRLPVHRLFILLTSIIFLFNAQEVINICKSNKSLVLIISYTLISAIWAGNPTETLKSFTFLSSCMLISILSVLAFNDNKLKLIRWLFWLFSLMTLGSILIALLHPEYGINTRSFSKPRWIGITAHPNGLGAESSILIWLAVNLFFLSKNKLEKLIITVSIASAFFTIIKADSMTSLISSFVLIILTWYYYYLDRLNSTFKILLLVITVFSAIILTTFYIGIDEIINTAFQSAGRSTHFSGRTRLWSIGLKALSDNFILGYGFDNLELLTRKYHLEMSHLHNGYLELVLKGGLISAIFLIIILLKTYFNLLKIKVFDKPDFIFLNTGFIMILLHNFTESSILKGIDPLNIFLLYILISSTLISKKTATINLTNNYNIKPLVNYGK